jgi:hypothetical protein
MPLFPGASLSVGFVNSCLGVSLAVRNAFLNEFSFWANSSCWVFDLLLGCQSSFREDLFLNDSPFWGKPPGQLFLLGF